MALWENLRPSLQPAWMGLGALWVCLTAVPIMCARLLGRACCPALRLNVRGRAILITGANTGIGFESALALFRGGATVVLGCRNAAKARVAQQRIEAARLDPAGRVLVVPLNLASFASVRACAAAILTAKDTAGNAVYPPLDSIVLNAGRNGRAGASVDGCHELYQTNYLGHFLLLQLLLPSVLRHAAAHDAAVDTAACDTTAAPLCAEGALQDLERELLRGGARARRAALQSAGHSARIVCVGSVMHHWGQRDASRSALYHVEGGAAAPVGSWEPNAYCDSKLHLILLAAAIERRCASRGVRGVSVNPGAVASDIWRDSWPAWFVPVWRLIMGLLFLTPRQGAATTLAALTAPLPDAPPLLAEAEERLGVGGADGAAASPPPNASRCAHYFVPYWLPLQSALCPCAGVRYVDPLQWLPFESLGMFAGARLVRPNLRGADAAEAGAELWAQSDDLVRRFTKKQD